MRVYREWDRLNTAPVPVLGVKDALAYLAAESKKARPAIANEKSGQRAEPKPQPDNDIEAAGVAALYPALQLRTQKTSAPTADVPNSTRTTTACGAMSRGCGLGSRPRRKDIYRDMMATVR